MQKLVAGIHHFQSNLFSSRKDLFEHLATGQNPEALFITCSDSRISPCLVTQTQPGDLFSLRNAGNIVPPYGPSYGGEAATIEFAVDSLGVKDVIICGHSHCGAMKGLLYRKYLQELPAVANWLTHAESTRRIMKIKYPHLTGDALLTAAVEENVLAQLENLQTHPCIAAGLAAGTLHLHGWVYVFEEGTMYAYDADEGQFNPLKEAKPVAAGAVVNTAPTTKGSAKV
jgi:carbonic anhydrase